MTFRSDTRIGRDIDYAAIAVTNALVAKFGGVTDLDKLAVTANERTISLLDGKRQAEGTRDELLAGIRNAATYEQLWQLLAGGANRR